MLMRVFRVSPLWYPFSACLLITLLYSSLRATPPLMLASFRRSPLFHEHRPTTILCLMSPPRQQLCWWLLHATFITAFWFYAAFAVFFSFLLFFFHFPLLIFFAADISFSAAIFADVSLSLSSLKMPLMLCFHAYFDAFAFAYFFAFMPFLIFADFFRWFSALMIIIDFRCYFRFRFAFDFISLIDACRWFSSFPLSYWFYWRSRSAPWYTRWCHFARLLRYYDASFLLLMLADCLGWLSRLSALLLSLLAIYFRWFSSLWLRFRQITLMRLRYFRFSLATFSPRLSSTLSFAFAYCHYCFSAVFMLIFLLSLLIEIYAPLIFAWLCRLHHFRYCLRFRCQRHAIFASWLRCCPWHLFIYRLLYYIICHFLSLRPFHHWFFFDSLLSPLILIISMFRLSPLLLRHYAWCHCHFDYWFSPAISFFAVGYASFSSFLMPLLIFAHTGWCFLPLLSSFIAFFDIAAIYIFAFAIIFCQLLLFSSFHFRLLFSLLFSWCHLRQLSATIRQAAASRFAFLITPFIGFMIDDRFSIHDFFRHCHAFRFFRWASLHCFSLIFSHFIDFTMLYSFRYAFDFLSPVFADYIRWLPLRLRLSFSSYDYFAMIAFAYFILPARC